MTARVSNFAPGPATLPLPMLEEAREYLVALPGAAASILEISHRSPVFEAVIEEAESNLRQLLEPAPTPRDPCAPPRPVRARRCVAPVLER